MNIAAEYGHMPITVSGVGELKIKYTILVLVWVLLARADLKKKTLHPNVHSSTIYNSQVLETV